MSSDDAESAVKIIFNIVGWIGIVVFMAPYFYVLIFGGEFTFSSEGAIPQLKQLFNVFKG